MTELRKSKNGVIPSSGASQPSGKTSDCDENLKFSDKKPETVTTLPVESDNDKQYEAMEAQNAGSVLVVSNSREDAIAEGRAAINRKALGK